MRQTLLILALSLAQVGLAGAQTDDSASSDSDAADQALDEETRASLDQEARANFEAGRIAYENASYERALSSFRRAYELSQRPQLLYNIGQSLDRLRRDVEALEEFEAFLEQNPDSHKRREVEARVAILREQVAAQPDVPTPAEAAATTVQPNPVAEPAPEPASKAWIAGVVGGVLVVVAVVLAVALTRDGGTADPQPGSFGMGVIEL